MLLHDMILRARGKDIHHIAMPVAAFAIFFHALLLS